MADQEQNGDGWLSGAWSLGQSLYNQAASAVNRWGRRMGGRAPRGPWPSGGEPAFKPWQRKALLCPSPAPASPERTIGGDSDPGAAGAGF